MGVGDLNSQRLKASSARHSKARRGMKASNLQSAAVQSEPFDTDMGNYSTPRIKMSIAVRTSLLTLRIYLIVLVSLLVYKFINVLTQ